MSKDTYDESAIELLRGLKKPERDDVTTLYSDDMPEELRRAAEKMMADHKDLWFVEIRDKNGKEIMVFRGPHP
ncbi:hypothetical protein [Ochrobactrum sp. BTU2]|uniref:hypothetical protein n=1 Tax=Ochrobactrum sp. BTU2 TaxID=2856166 RepID=UPI00211AA32F|nr:hypothetical protein [Ochrobactrum sp. BTU2]MCQ9147713.1 hypothetical protein [Ochrobactrum sp. BTU2]